MRIIDGDKLVADLESIALVVEGEGKHDEAEIFRMFADIVRKQPEIKTVDVD